MFIFLSISLLLYSSLVLFCSFFSMSFFCSPFPLSSWPFKHFFSVVSDLHFLRASHLFFSWFLAICIRSFWSYCCSVQRICYRTHRNLAFHSIIHLPLQCMSYTATTHSNFWCRSFIEVNFRLSTRTRFSLRHFFFSHKNPWLVNVDFNEILEFDHVT